MGGELLLCWYSCWWKGLGSVTPGVVNIGEFLAEFDILPYFVFLLPSVAGWGYSCDSSEGSGELMDVAVAAFGGDFFNSAFCGSQLLLCHVNAIAVKQRLGTEAKFFLRADAQVSVGTMAGFFVVGG